MPQAMTRPSTGPLSLRPDHFTVLSDDLDATRDFYRALLDFEPGPRPDFSMGGLWLYANGHPLLHVVERDRLPEPRNGVLDHMAFRGAGEAELAILRARLDARGVEYRLVRTPAPWRQWQIFFTDPNGATVEVDFAAGGEGSA